MTRQTSTVAYHLIKENGLLSKLRLEIYEILFHHGPLTAMEAWRKMGDMRTQHSVSPRMAELRNLGVVKEVKQRPCSVTGMTAIEWDVTDRLPAKFEKEKRHKCKFCNGKGFISEQQTKLF